MRVKYLIPSWVHAVCMPPTSERDPGRGLARLLNCPRPGGCGALMSFSSVADHLMWGERGRAHWPNVRSLLSHSSSLSNNNNNNHPHHGPLPHMRSLSAKKGASRPTVSFVPAAGWQLTQRNRPNAFPRTKSWVTHSSAQTAFTASLPARLTLATKRRDVALGEWYPVWRHTITDGDRYSEGGPGPIRTSATQGAQSSSIPRPVMPTASRSAGPSSPPFLYQNAGTSGPADPGGQSADLISQESILNALADSGPRRASLQWETAPLELSPVEFSLQPTPTTVDQTLPAGSLAQDNAAGGLIPAGDITNSQLATSSTHIVFPDAPINRHSQVEDIAPWPVITFFLTLYLQYMHSLFPIVHKPSFHQIVTMRTDRSDRNARALICALGEPWLSPGSSFYPC